MNKASTRPLELLYEGSVKRVWRAPSASDRLWFEFTDDYSVFDWGKMPDTIANKGRALTVIGAYLFDELARPEFWQALTHSQHLKRFDAKWLAQRFKHDVFAGVTGLSKAGLSHHFTGLKQDPDHAADTSGSLDLAAAGSSSEPIYMEVMRADVHRPTLHRILHQSVYAYTQEFDKSKLHLVPLEIVFRFGMPSGSSLIDRLKKDPTYVQELGIANPTPGSFFEHPVVEFYTKLEPKDRLLSWQEAVLMSGLDGAGFEKMVELALDIALALYVIFAERNIELWDGKVEMVAAGSDIVLADSIGPDELRLLYEGCHLSKEMIRQMYRGSKWEVALKEAQHLAKTENLRPWKEIATEQLKVAPDPLSSESKAIVDQLYGVLANHLTSKAIFKNHLSMKEFIDALPPGLHPERSSRASSSTKRVEEDAVSNSNSNSSSNPKSNSKLNSGDAESVLDSPSNSMLQSGAGRSAELAEPCTASLDRIRSEEK